MRESVYLVSALLGTLLSLPLRAEPATLAGPSLSGAIAVREAAQARLEARNWWLQGELPGGPAGDPALRGNLTAGHRLTGIPCEAGTWCEGMAFSLTPVVRAVLDAPAQGSHAAPQLGFALTQGLAWSFHPGLTLAMSGGIGERVALSAPLRPGGGALVAVKASIRMAAELDRFGGPPLRLALAVQAVRPLLGAEGMPLPEDCKLQLELAGKTGAPFHLTAPCGFAGTIGFGMRAAF
jgi:hypothetical protein